jgi:NAD-dependent dihydropyrimidine dehydrogenase PreA subunit
MVKNSPIRTATLFTLIVVLVAGLSILSNRFWGGKPEPLPEKKRFITADEMTILQFGQVNGLPNTVLQEIFEVKAQSDLETTLRAYGTSDQVAAMVTKKLALAREHAGKNWIKISLRFGLWFAFLSAVFIFLKKRKAASGIRNWLLCIAVFIFGVVLGPDPNPMATVKDAIYLYGTTHAIFPPRMIALGVFLAIVIFANKYMCAWGCQAGTLQDLIFQINQTDQRKAVIGRQIKFPFVMTNATRVIFFCMFILIAFSEGIDIIAPISPFKIYQPMYLGLFGGIFLGVLLLASLFIYRPWCHFFCPFGLVSWLVEKASIVKISVDYKTCIACQKCATACPSTVMGAILRCDKRTIPDCFACYACREVCPTNSISFSSRKRTLPPSDHFDKKDKNIQ